MSDLRDQFIFTKKVAELILLAYSIGYTVSLGDAYRDPRLHGALGVKKGYGSARSFHKRRLALDLNLFKDGKYLTSAEDHRPLGEWWIAQGGSWGGAFRTGSVGDANHYSWGEESNT